MTNGQPDLLRGLTGGQIEQALRMGARLTLGAGAELFSLGAHADRLFLIERGRIKLTLPMKVRGLDQDILVGERTAGETVGWSALIPPYRFTLKASTLLETEVIAFSRETLATLFAAHPDIGCVMSLNLAAVVGQRLELFQAMWLREMQRVVELRCA